MPDSKSIPVARMSSLPSLMIITSYEYAGFVKDIALLFEQLTIWHAAEGSYFFFHCKFSMLMHIHYFAH